MLAAEIDCTHEDNGEKYFSLKSTAVLNQPGILEGRGMLSIPARDIKTPGKMSAEVLPLLQQ